VCKSQMYARSQSSAISLCSNVKQRFKYFLKSGIPISKKLSFTQKLAEECRNIGTEVLLPASESVAWSPILGVGNVSTETSEYSCVILGLGWRCLVLCLRLPPNRDAIQRLQSQRRDTQQLSYLCAS